MQLVATLALAAVVHTARTWDGCQVHVLTIPAGSTVYPAAHRPGRTVQAFVNDTHAVAGINGGYFNHSDGWPVSHVRRGNAALTDPARNRALTGNKALAPVLTRILNHRAEWRHVTTPNGQRWQVAYHDAPRQGVLASLQAGPQLLPRLDLDGEAFVLRSGRKITRDGIGSQARATRSALGIRADGALLLVGVGTPGVTIDGLRKLMQALGAAEALNLDGGSSTGLVWREGGELKHFYGGHAPARVNSVILVGP